MKIPRSKIWGIWVLALIFLMGAVACSSTSQKRSIGEVIDDSVISNKLKVKFLKDKTVKGFKINIDTWKGVVSLRGKVDNQEQINRAVEIAERQPGVREVKSYLVLREQINRVEEIEKSEAPDKKPVKQEEAVAEESDPEILEESVVDAPPDQIITD